MNDFSHNDQPISMSEDRFGIDELNLHAEKVDQAHIHPLLTALFEVADEINVEEDRGGGFSMASNELRRRRVSPEVSEFLDAWRRQERGEDE